MLIREQLDSAMTLQNTVVMGAILSGLRDLAGKNILEAPVFKGQFDKRAVAAIKKNTTDSDGFWAEVANILIQKPENMSIRVKLPGMAEATVKKYSPLQGEPGDFWKIGQELRRAVEGGQEDVLSGVLRAADEAVSGDLSRCPWSACRAFYGLQEPYRDEVLDYLEGEGIEGAREAGDDLWFLGSDSQYHHALARFILNHKEFWAAMCHDVTLFILNETGAEGVSQFVMAM